MAQEQGFYLKMKGFIDSKKAGVLTLDEFSDHIDNAYAHKQQGKVEILEICQSPEYLEHVGSAIALANQGLSHLERGFDLLFQYIEDPRASLLDSALCSFKECTDSFGRASESALNESEEANLSWEF